MGVITIFLFFVGVIHLLARRVVVFFLVFVALLLAAATFASNIFLYTDEASQAAGFRTLMIQMIQQLITKGFDRFVTMPLGPGSDFIHLTGSQLYPEYPDYYMIMGINVQDDLDMLILEKIDEASTNRSWFQRFSELSFDDISLNSDDIQHLQTVYLFKTEQDLKDLGYVVSSYRTMVNNDVDRRRDNIFISYRNIGNVRVLNPDQRFSFMDEIRYDPSVKNQFLYAGFIFICVTIPLEFHFRDLMIHLYG